MLLWWTFCTRRSILLRNKITEMFSNILLLIIVSNMFFDSWTRLVLLSSNRTWSYSELEAMKRMLVTELKHWNHFCRWVRCPPTSTKRKGTLQEVEIIRKCRQILLPHSKVGQKSAWSQNYRTTWMNATFNVLEAKQVCQLAHLSISILNSITPLVVFLQKRISCRVGT